MSEPISDQATTVPAQSVPVLPTDFNIHSDALATLKSEGEALVAAIKNNAEMTAKELAAIQEVTAAAQKQLEGGKATITDINSLFTATQATNNQAMETKTQAAAALESIRSFVNTATEAANRLEALKTQAEAAQGVIAAKSEHIEAGREHVDKVRKELDTVLTQAQQSATSAEALHQAGRAAAESLNSLYTAAQAVKANTDSNAESVATLRKQCEDHIVATTKLAEIALSTEAKVKAYEARLAELEIAAAERLKTIESLLPGATSAGLATAFNERRAYFKWPQRIWQCVFVVCVLALLALAALEFGVIARADALGSYDKVGLSLLHRLPFALPLIWLAFHAAHKAALAQRLEEDYSFKETVSRSFEGYRREMAELQGKVTPDSPLARLCTSTLGIITRRPGLIYEKHALTKTPMDAVGETATSILEAAGKIKPLKTGE
jgi:hypothetical protein